MDHRVSGLSSYRIIGLKLYNPIKPTNQQTNKPNNRRGFAPLEKFGGGIKLPLARAVSAIKDKSPKGIRGRNSLTGFTLIEMTIVLVIILAFLAMTLPFFANFSSSTGLKTAYREAVTALRTARTYAIAKNKNYEVVFDTGTVPNRFWIAEAAGDKMIDKGFELPSTISFSSAVTVTFVPTGGLSGGADATVTLSNTKGKTRSIKISAATGAVEETTVE